MTNKLLTDNQPTLEAYEPLQQAFDYFNSEIFAGQLPKCLLTLQRDKKSYGYFSSQRFLSARDGSKTDEIAMNPAYFGLRPTKDVLSTLVHEMSHCWQHYHGKAGRRGYHNMEWADFMEHNIGLIPSSTGLPGGKRIGEKMSHYIKANGRFDRAAQKLIDAGYSLFWVDRQPSKHVTPQALADAEKDGVDLEGMDIEIAPPKPPSIGRLKYTCFGCNTHIWAKPKLVSLLCTNCDQKFQVNDNKADDLEAIERAHALAKDQDPDQDMAA